MFPLKSIFFPGEMVHLHIFEDRYKELIRDVSNGDGVFGIPVYMDGRIAFGTEMQLEKIIKTYSNGAMDVVCMAKRVFKIHTFQNTMMSKKYAGGEVSILPYYHDGTASHKIEIIKLMVRLYKLMGAAVLIEDAVNINLNLWLHRIGLSMAQEYELLQMRYESECYIFIKSHLQNMIQVLIQVNRTKDLIGMNGHFRSFDPLDFKNFEL